MKARKIIKKRIALILAACFLAAGFLLNLVSTTYTGSILEQNVVKYYGTDAEFAQITLFCSGNADFTQNNLHAIRGSINKNFGAGGKADSAESIVGGRPFIDAYSSKVKLSYISDKTAAEIETVGVGGDFFLFHPYNLVSGGYFSESTDENSDGVVLNELAAWQLFGAIDIAGMYITCGDLTLQIRGVISEQDGLFAKASGQNEPRVYLAFDAMEYAAGLTADSEGLELAAPITCYEVLIYDPVKDFGFEAVKEAFKEASLEAEDFTYVVNSERFDYFKRILLTKDFFKRVMSTSDIIYPFWENRARAAEQLVMLLMLAQLLFYLATVIFFIIGLVGLRDDFRRFKAFLRRKCGDLKEFIIAKQRKQ